jgi:hypothetical protein
MRTFGPILVGCGLTLSLHATAQIPNSSFDRWVPGYFGVLRPEHWYSNNFTAPSVLTRLIEGTDTIARLAATIDCPATLVLPSAVAYHDHPVSFHLRARWNAGSQATIAVVSQREVDPGHLVGFTYDVLTLQGSSAAWSDVEMPITYYSSHMMDSVTVSFYVSTGGGYVDVDSIWFELGTTVGEMTDGEAPQLTCTSDAIIVSSNAPLEGRVLVTDVSGRVVHDQRTGSQTTYTVDVSHWPAGLYAVEILERSTGGGQKWKAWVFH